jgi:hypothetical protein
MATGNSVTSAPPLVIRLSRNMRLIAPPRAIGLLRTFRKDRLSTACLWQFELT